MSTKIQALLERVLGDGGRAAKYVVKLPLPAKDATNKFSSSDLNIICKGASFPGKTLDTIPFTYRGRTIPLPGQHKYSQSWDLSFYLDESHVSRLYFMDWMQAMNTPNESYYKSDNNKNDGQTSILTEAIRKLPRQSKTTTIVVQQLNFDMNTTVADYTLYNCYPISVSDVTLGSDQVGAIGEYTVSFSFSHFMIQSKTAPFKVYQG